MGALTKADMAERLYEEVGLNKREAKEMVESFFDEARSSLGHNEQVKLSDSGTLTFETKNNAQGVLLRRGKRFLLLLVE